MAIICIYVTAHTASTFFSVIGFMLICLVVITVALLIIHLYLCFGPTHVQNEARFGLFFPFCFFILLISVAEYVLPPLAPSEGQYTETQISIQEQLARRNFIASPEFRGVTLNVHFNDLGWADKQRDYGASQHQIVFIGDSFLEVTSSKNIAQRVEALLSSRGIDKDVINLSKAGTGPEQYEYRFWEIAIELNPDQIFVFVFEANDFSPGYKYKPYTHPSFYISEKALTFLDKNLDKKDIPSETKLMLAKLKREGKKFKNKSELFEYLQDNPLSQNQLYLIYQALYSYSGEDNSYPLFPKFFTSLSKIFLSVKRYFLPLPSPPKTFFTFYPNYSKIFEFPKDKRLDAIAESIDNYYDVTDHRCLSILKKQNDEFINSLIEQADMPYYLLPAMDNVLQQGNISTWAHGLKLNEEIVNEYVKLFKEMHQASENRNINFTVVLIPEASYGDEAFREFWKPMIDFQTFFPWQHCLYLSLKEKFMENKIPVVDLGDFKPDFHEGYWKFDGHWNEKGNQRAAEIIAAYIGDKQHDAYK